MKPRCLASCSRPTLGLPLRYPVTTFRFGENQMHRLTVYTVVGGGLGLGNAWGITRKLFRADRFSRRHDRLHLHSCRLKNAPTDSGHYSRLLHIARWNIEHHTKFIVSPGRRGTDLRPLSRRFAVLSLKFSLTFSFFSFFHIFFLFLSFLRLVLSVPIVDASWHTFIIHSRWFHRNRGLRAGGKLTIPALPLFVLSPGVVKYPAAGWWDALERELQPSAPVFGKYLNARQREWESCLVARVYRLRSSL